ncbi:bifunctional UDP-2,4-diacetamido-2,4,6-trideoxy-beta-L-altropyranose hydrolase/GNAT family N-acetyltransferase, partial [Acetoanaerobium noterae]|uniref:bifunctional UDP-2,4-diacetamido-2,4,6-trideoxy-beta-L-altropyranose hydrolase/GNAT family N-acetyltransferase n=1 Tax=Acetoanaerobium noterae TaxID=745369 RepID=UPI0032213F9C
HKVLVSLGGGDGSAFLALLKPVLELSDLAGCTIRVIAGATPRDALAKLSDASPAEIEILSQADDMPSLMKWADLCISAGGSTCWELCCLGVPFLTVELAANQRLIVHGLEASGIAPALSVAAFRALLQDACARRKASRAGLDLVDGLGSDKVAARMAGSPCLLRPVSADDRELVWRIANSPEVRAMSGSTADIPWDSHCIWFERQLASPRPPFYVVCHVSGEPAGYVRFSVESGEAVISIALDGKWRNRGMGAKAIELGCARLRAMHPSIPVAAFVRPGNEASLKAFARAGFARDGMRSFHGGEMHRLCLTENVVTHTPCAETDSL